MYYWKLPPTPTIDLYRDMISQTHLLIAGATGSGKTTLLTGLLDTMLHDPPDARQLIILDRKHTTLKAYTHAPHTMRHARTLDEMVMTLRDTIDLMQRRFDYIEHHGDNFSDVYLVIDELADLMTTRKRQAATLLQELGQLARESKIHIIAATQCPLREVIPTPIKVNFPARVALKCATRQDSRNIIDQAGAELLPDPQTEHRAQCLYRHGAITEKWNLPKPTSETEYLIQYWTHAKKHFDGKRHTA